MTEDPTQADQSGRKEMLVLILAVAAASLVFRIATATGQEHTAFVFIGVPTVLAVAVAMMPRTTSARGTIFRATTLALLLAGIAFGEAFVCILFAAPLIYLVAFGVGEFVEWSEKRRGRGRERFDPSQVVVRGQLDARAHRHQRGQHGLDAIVDLRVINHGIAGFHQRW